MTQVPRGCQPNTQDTSHGRSAYEVIADIVQSSTSIDFINLVTYEEGPNWRDLRQAGKIDEEALSVKGLEQDLGERTFVKLSRKEVFAENLRRIAQNIKGNRLLGVVSKVILVGGALGHIPMMDFMSAPSASNLELLTRLLKNLHLGRGYVLESGKSYHYYAFRVLSEDEWRIFLGKCLLMSGHTDDRYIGHQLVDGHCVLRLSAGKLKSRIPRVVAEIQ